MRGDQESPARVDERLGFLFAVARNPVLVIEHVEAVENATILDLNPQASELYGYAREDLIGQRMSVLAAGTRSRSITPIAPGAAYDTDVVQRRADGQVLIVEQSYQVIESAGEKLLLVSANDVTSSRLLERALLRVQQIDNLGVVSGTMVHDFRNLLVGILGNAELALREAQLPSTARQRIVDIEHNALRASELVHRLLPSGGVMTGSFNRVDLNELVSDTLSMLRASFDPGVTLQQVLTPGLPHFLGDATQVRQAVMNLVINAGEAVGDTYGVVTVTTSVAPAAAIDFSSARPTIQHPSGDWLILEVRDSGIGMDDVTLARIFEPLFTTKTSGTGLGLAAVMFAVRRHGGAVCVSSSPGHGATFRVFLPVQKS